ncbi:MAG: hypothetical protein PF505_07475 [Vallitaleaceae bacterium]|jgi:hypothetical protein|nr:hypothetical protein [Vallitaleaceae bacterium]
MRSMGKAIILIVSMIVTLIFITGCSLFPDAELGLKKTELSGDIQVLSSELEADQVVPLVLSIPDKLDALHKEMWSIEYMGESDKVASGMLLEAEDFDAYFSLSEIESIFASSNMAVMIENDNGGASDSAGDIYNPKLAIFTPEVVGAYHIEVYGYYKNTSPRFVTELDITIK